MEKIILIGHSLGAHISGITGKKVTAGKIPKIFGLDPANPLFSYDKVNERIATGDARTVETIHTAAGLVGFTEPLGDINFYPNGGSYQPGCGIDLTGACAHSRSHKYFAESINTKVGFYGYQCQSHQEIKKGKCTVIGAIKAMGGDPGNQQL